MRNDEQLSARERQVLQAVYTLGEATATDVLAAIPDPPSRSAVRTFLRILEEKGKLRHRRSGREYVYRPTRSRTRAGQAAVRNCSRPTSKARSKKPWPITWPTRRLKLRLTNWTVSKTLSATPENRGDDDDPLGN